MPFFKDFEFPQNGFGKFLYVPEKVDYPRKDNSNYPYSFFSNLLPLLIPAIGKLNKINILFENRRVFGVFTMWENKKALGYGRSPHISRLNFFLLDANQFYLFQDNNVCPLHRANIFTILLIMIFQSYLLAAAFPSARSASERCLQGIRLHEAYMQDLHLQE